jgi:hypothetical protein
MAKNIPKLVEVRLSSCGLEVADFRKNCDCGIAEIRLRSNISLKSCGIAIAEVLPSSCGIAIADSKKNCAGPPLVFMYIVYCPLQLKLHNTSDGQFFRKKVCFILKG